MSPILYICIFIATSLETHESHLVNPLPIHVPTNTSQGKAFQPENHVNSNLEEKRGDEDTKHQP